MSTTARLRHGWALALAAFLSPMACSTSDPGRVVIEPGHGPSRTFPDFDATTGSDASGGGEGGAPDVDADADDADSG